MVRLLVALRIALRRSSALGSSRVDVRHLCGCGSAASVASLSAQSAALSLAVAPLAHSPPTLDVWSTLHADFASWPRSRSTGADL